MGIITMQNAEPENTPIEDWQAQRDRLLRIAKARGVPDTSASDVVNSSIRRTYGQDPSKHNFAYLVTSLFNTLRDRLRRKKRRKTVNMGDDDNSFADGTEGDFVERLAIQSEAGQLIATLMNELNDREKAVFELYYLQQKKRAEVCAILNITQGTLAHIIRTIQTKAGLISGDDSDKNDPD